MLLFLMGYPWTCSVHMVWVKEKHDSPLVCGSVGLSLTVVSWSLRDEEGKWESWGAKGHPLYLDCLRRAKSLQPRPGSCHRKTPASLKRPGSSPGLCHSGSEWICWPLQASGSCCVRWERGFLWAAAVGQALMAQLAASSPRMVIKGSTSSLRYPRPQGGRSFGGSHEVMPHKQAASLRGMACMSGELSCVFSRQVQCHSYTGYCWCVTPNGRPVSGTAVAHKTPRCPGRSGQTWLLGD